MLHVRKWQHTVSNGGSETLTKLDVLAVLGLKLLTGNSDLAAVAVVENGRSIDRACVRRSNCIGRSNCQLALYRTFALLLLPIKILQFLQSVTSTSEV